MFDIEELIKTTSVIDRYNRQLERLKCKGFSIDRFQDVIDKTISNLNNGIKSFVIYGDPQSGKTEMMITLTAKLLDEGHKLIIVLLNDDVNLLNQNSRRFTSAGLNPAPKTAPADIISPDVRIDNEECIIFCKKNSKNLQKLISKIKQIESRVIIDDEGDYATPNAKVNKRKQTKINELVEQLLKGGIYIGVTATPARLDLNNTFYNTSKHWVRFGSHDKYFGQDIFFPIDKKIDFKLKLLPEKGDEPKYLRGAFFRFIVNVAYLNITNSEKEQAYCMLIHTSGKIADHSKDYQQVVKILSTLKDRANDKFKQYYEEIYNIALENFKKELADKIVRFVISRIGKNKIVTINKDADKNNIPMATNPQALFTIAIGGNIVSRGVTFKNLLSMFFTRDVKHKMQQDTYIQRARMFGSRGSYLKFFELTIPSQLYSDWHKCFIFHRLSLQSAISGTPVWLGDSRTRPVASSSIDKTTVKMDSGEMSFSVFDYNPNFKEIIDDNNIDSFAKIGKIKALVEEECLPPHIVDFIENFSPNGVGSLEIHSSKSISGWTSMSEVEKNNIQRAKGFIGSGDTDKYPHAIHHIRIFFNSENKARLFYKYINNIKFIKNLR